jgi:isopropylmalate/homocitrate/citramalate synthase
MKKSIFLSFIVFFLFSFVFAQNVTYQKSKIQEILEFFIQRYTSSFVVGVNKVVETFKGENSYSSLNTKINFDANKYANSFQSGLSTVYENLSSGSDDLLSFFEKEMKTFGIKLTKTQTDILLGYIDELTDKEKGEYIEIYKSLNIVNREKMLQEVYESLSEKVTITKEKMNQVICLFEFL